MPVVPLQSPPHFGQSSQKGKERLSERLDLCLRPTGQGKLRQLNHRTTKSGSFWEDVGHADVATGRGVLSLRSFVNKALALFLFPSFGKRFNAVANFITYTLEESPFFFFCSCCFCRIIKSPMFAFHLRRSHWTFISCISA